VSKWNKKCEQEILLCFQCLSFFRNAYKSKKIISFVFTYAVVFASAWESMNIHFLQHVPFEHLGALERWVNQPGNKVTSTRLYEESKLPFVDLFDVLIILGGPMSVHDEDRYRWLIAEKTLIKKALEKGKKVIGICLGAQLIAEAMGGRVSLNAEQEIGWFPIEWSKEALAHPCFEGLPNPMPAFHWHGEYFSIPEDATPLGKTEACINQGFIWKNQVLAFQFHLEMTAQGIEGLIRNCPEDLNGGAFVQDAAQLLRPDLIEEAHNALIKIVDRFIAL
jgi:GMP synthase-like glutamine amidotransferase